MKGLIRFLLPLFLTLFACSGIKAEIRIIHVLVALCDNKSQGIVPVPAKIGNGDDPDNNLYWGCGYGVRTHFKNSAEWKLITKQKNPRTDILERVIFKHVSADVYLVADGYQGNKIKNCVTNFFNAASGNLSDTVILKQQTLQLSNASLVCYDGHDGLMDFALDSYPVQKGDAKKDVMVLACYSRDFFSEGIKKAGANPVLWTSHLCSPEAYTLKDAIDGWILKETGQQIRKRAATAYDAILKCGIKGAMNLWVTGF